MKPESGRYEDQMAAGLHVAYERDASERVNRISSIPFALVHLVPFAIIWTGVAWRDIVCARCCTGLGCSGGVSWMSQQAAAWLSGDIVVLVDDVNATKEGRPGLYEALFAGRNRRWVPRIDSLLKNRTTAMVVVGMGHLTGDEGVLALLEASGHPVVRVS